jgi:beta-lactamase superfamily II metal-dependent hydrolase
MDNGLPSTTQTYRGLLESVQAAGSQLLEPAGQSISLGEASLRIIPPPKDASLGDNNNSIGIIIDLGEFEAALTGDAENKEFSWWLNHSEFLQEVEIYKASHHGSKNGDSEASVSTFSPEVVVISASLNNPYGHPSAEALSLYQAIGATVFRTDLDGSIIITGRADGTYSVVSGGE